MNSDYLFHDGTIDISVDLKELAGKCLLDFHLLKHADRYLGFWPDAALSAIERGELPTSGGGFRGRSFPAKNLKRLGFQLDSTIFAFEFLQLPGDSTVSVLEPQKTALHTGNLGGTRLRIELPQGTRDSSLRLKFRTVEWPQ